MSIKFTTKNVKFPGALKAFTEEGLMGIEKISGDIIDAEIIAGEEKLNFHVEINLKTRLNSYHAAEKDPILKQAVRTALTTLKNQAKKNKEKLARDKKRRDKDITDRFKTFDEGAAAGAAPPMEDSAAMPRVTVSENFSRKPVSVEEAVFFLKDSGENAYMFTNVETNRISVVFYDSDKNISIIEAD